MKLLSTILLVSVTCSFGQGGHPLLLKKKRSVDGLPQALTGCDANAGPWLVFQTFETPTTGYDNGETWTGTGTGTVDPAYTGVVLQGTQSLRLNQSANTAQTITSFAAQDELYGYFMFRAISGFPGNPSFLVWLNDSSTIGIEVNSDATLTITGNIASTTVATMTTNVTYHIWWHYKKSPGGANQIQEIAFSTDTLKPTSGNNYAGTSGGSRTTQITSFQCGWDSFAFTQQFIFDKIRISTNCIGSNPP